MVPGPRAGCRPSPRNTTLRRRTGGSDKEDPPTGHVAPSSFSPPRRAERLRSGPNTARPGAAHGNPRSREYATRSAPMALRSTGYCPDAQKAFPAPRLLRPGARGARWIRPWRRRTPRKVPFSGVPCATRMNAKNAGRSDAARSRAQPHHHRAIQMQCTETRPASLTFVKRPEWVKSP
jgi:hypothetical protein